MALAVVRPSTGTRPATSSTSPVDIALAAPAGVQAREAAECRLDGELRDLAALTARSGGSSQRDWPAQGSHRDWRQIEPLEVASRFKTGVESTQNRTLLARSLFVGTAQAVVKGSYTAPYASSTEAEEVDCRHVRRPVSRLYGSDQMPADKAMKVRSPRSDLEGGGLAFRPGLSPLDACAEWWAHIERHRIALVRFTATKDPRNERMSYSHCRDDELFLRTSYYQAFEKLSTDISAPVGDAIDHGGLIYTSGVGILRGPLDHGAQWYKDPPRIDVIWAGLPANPQLAEQEQYACEQDRVNAARVVDRIFAYAAAAEVDVLVLPPLGCGTHCCQHPSLDMADILHETRVRYQRYIPQLVFASCYPQHCEVGWWESFESAVRDGRPAVHRPIKVPVPPYPRAAKDPSALAEKAKRLATKPQSRAGGGRPERRTALRVPHTLPL